jgi:hypothetical protein
MDLGERYLELALRFGRIAPDLVSSYAGPPELAARVAAEPPPAAADLADQAGALRAAVDAEEPDAARRRWLSAQLSALATACRALGGESFSYRELVERCHGVRPALVPEESFAAAHELLDDALPGSGAVRDRYQAWLASQLVAPDRVLGVINALANDLRDRTRTAFGLPAGERVEIELVRNKRWSGFADYRGELCTRIEINTDLPLHLFRLVDLAAHEMYPGHHTEHVIKEIELVRGRGRFEHAVFVDPTPQALVAEGLAMIAREQVPALGGAYDDQMVRVALAVMEALAPVRANIAILVDEHGVSVDDARAYARRWMLEPDARVDKAVDGLLARPWRPYESCYPEGHKLCRAFAQRQPDGFRRLLAEPLTTADLL